MAVPPALCKQLDEVFTAAHCEELLEAAKKWCTENGAWCLNELAADDVFPEFQQELGLKKLQARRLKEAMKDALGVAPERTASSEPIGAESLGAESLADLEVKNTFVDYKQPPLSSVLTDKSRAQTVGGYFSGNRNTGSLPEVAEDEEDAEYGDDFLGKSEALPQSALTRLETHEDYGFSQHGRSLERYGTHEDYGYSLPYQAPPGIEKSTEEEMVSPDGTPLPNPFMPPPGMPMAPMYPMMPMYPMNPMMPMMPMMPGMYMPGAMADAGVERKAKAQTVVPVYKHYRRRDGRNEHRMQYHWTVDGKKLRSSDREAVSPPFTVKDCFNLEFKLVLKPKVVEYVKGGSSFRNSRGKGYIELRCVSEHDALMSCEATLSFKLSIKSAKRTEKFRGSVFHCFRDRATCGLVESQDEWEFGKIVDDTGTFVVILECDPKAQ